MAAHVEERLAETSRNYPSLNDKNSVDFKIKKKKTVMLEQYSKRKAYFKC